MSDRHARNMTWYAYEFETAGDAKNPKVIAYEVQFRMRTLKPHESAHFIPEGPQVSKLARFLDNNSWLKGSSSPPKGTVADSDGDDGA